MGFRYKRKMEDFVFAVNPALARIRSSVQAVDRINFARYIARLSLRSGVNVFIRLLYVKSETGISVIGRKLNVMVVANPVTTLMIRTGLKNVMFL